MQRSFALALVSVLGLLALLPQVGCAEETIDDLAHSDSDVGVETGQESALTKSEKDVVCAAVPTHVFTQAESDKLRTGVVSRFISLKKQNDALIKQRGVGAYAGVRSSVMKAVDRGDLTTAANLIQPKLKPGNDARTIASELQGTSCIGRVYAILREVYKDLGRQSEWAAIEKCGRAWDSDGLHVQTALIKNGWPSPTLGLVSDANKLPGSADEIALHREFLNAQARGSYYGTPVSKTMLLKNFLPSPGSSTQKDDALLLTLGRSTFLGVGTLRGAFHVPFLVPAAMIPADLAPTGADRQAWLDAKTRGEPFVMESHSLRQPWDDTNFEVRPLTAVIAQTFTESATYATGNILLAPGSSFVVR